jgi:hypothetical protein
MPSHHLNDTERSSQSIFLHSNDAVVSISDAEKIFYLNEAIVAPSGYRLIIGLTNMTMPNAMYNVTSNNKTIVISGVSYDIDEGNYSAESLATAVSTKISSVGTCAFDDTNNNNKYIFTFTAGAKTIDAETTLTRQLGLTGQLPLENAVTSYNATGICDLGGTTNIYIRLRNLTMNNIDSRGQTNNIIASIVNNTNYGGYIFFVPPEVLYYQITEQNISHLDIELTDQEGKLLEMNGANFNLTLTIHYVKQRVSQFRNSLLREIRESYNPEIKEDENKK